VDVIQKPEGILSQSIPDMAEEIWRKTLEAAKANLENLEFMRNRELEKPDINKREKLEYKAEQK
jgi:two-component system chemotaxis response regulator CheB